MYISGLLISNYFLNKNIIDYRLNQSKDLLQMLTLEQKLVFLLHLWV